jgi:putative DNA primase/helicase
MRDGAAIAAQLGGRRTARGWLFCCPVHEDRVASCSVRDDGFVTCFAGCDRKEVAAKLDALGFPDDGQASTAPLKDDVPGRVSTAQRMWEDALEDRPYVASYLRSRGITLPVPAVLRRWKRGYIAAVQRRDGVLIAVQTKGANQKGRTFGWLSDGAVHLTPCGEELGLAEGIETALSATQIHGIPCWAVLGALRLDKIGIPGKVKRIHLFPDNDQPGREAVDRAIDQYSNRVKIKIHWPPQGKDWNDVLSGSDNSVKQQQYRATAR